MSDTAKTLCELSELFIWDGDLMRCRSCNRAIHISRDKEALSHASGCKSVAAIYPWSALRILIYEEEYQKSGAYKSPITCVEDQIDLAQTAEAIIRECQSVLETLVDPSKIRGISTINVWANCVAAETRARLFLTKEVVIKTDAVPEEVRP